MKTFLRRLAIFLVAAMLVAGYVMFIELFGEPDDYYYAEANGTIPNVISDDDVFVIDVTTNGPRADGWIMPVVFATPDAGISGIRDSTAFDAGGNQLPYCGRGECIDFHVTCTDDECNSRTLIPIPSELVGRAGVKWTVGATVNDGNGDSGLEIRAASSPLADLGLPRDWEPPGQNVVFSQGWSELKPSQTVGLWNASFSFSTSGELSDLLLLAEAEVLDRPDAELRVYDADGNPITTSPRPYRASNPTKTINHLFSTDGRGNATATVYLVGPDTLNVGDEIVVRLVMVDPTGAPLPDSTFTRTWVNTLNEHQIPFELPGLGKRDD